MLLPALKLALASLSLALLVLTSCLPPAGSSGPAATPVTALASPTAGQASTAAPTAGPDSLLTPANLQEAYPPAPSLSQAYPPAAAGGGERSEPQAAAPAEIEGNSFVPATGRSRGYQTTPQELAAIADKASQGLEPYRSAVAEVLAEAGKPWDYKLDSEVRCPNADRPAWNDNDQGTPRLYARALAYHLTGEARYAQETVAILEQIMTEVQSISLKQTQCRLNFSWGTPELVASADLVEEYWQALTCTGPASSVYGENELAQGPCKRLFQNWLVKIPYYLVSYSAEHSQNNWGAAATNTTAYIADYLWDRPEVKLVARTMSGELALSPAEAYERANQQALDRMNGYRVDEISSLSCDFLTGREQNKDAPPVKSQISELGIIPDEARRDQACNIQAYNGAYQNYPQLHLGNNIQQCELMLRRGDSSCYDNVSTEEVTGFTYRDRKGQQRSTTLRAGRGSIERAIWAIIVNSGTEWRKDSSLEVAYRYYAANHTLPGIELWPAQIQRPSGCSQDICFGTLTHGGL